MGLSLLTAAVRASASSADLVPVKVTSTGEELYRFDVRVRHAAQDGNTMPISARRQPLVGEFSAPGRCSIRMSKNNPLRDH
jgi:hypothetical protein